MDSQGGSSHTNEAERSSQTMDDSSDRATKLAEAYEMDVALTAASILETVHATGRVSVVDLISQAVEKPMAWLYDVVCTVESSGRVVRDVANDVEGWVVAVEEMKPSPAAQFPQMGPLLASILATTEAISSRHDLTTLVDVYASEDLAIQSWCDENNKESFVDLAEDSLLAMKILLESSSPESYQWRSAETTKYWTQELDEVFPREDEVVEYLAQDPVYLFRARTAESFSSLLQGFRLSLPSSSKFRHWWISSLEAPVNVILRQFGRRDILLSDPNSTILQWNAVALIEQAFNCRKKTPPPTTQFAWSLDVVKTLVEVAKDTFFTREIKFIMPDKDIPLTYTKTIAEAPPRTASKQAFVSQMVEKMKQRTSVDCARHETNRPNINVAQCSIESSTHATSSSAEEKPVNSTQTDTNSSSGVMPQPVGFDQNLESSVAIVAIVLDRHGYFPVSDFMAWIKTLPKKKLGGKTHDEFFDVVVSAVSLFATVSSDAPQMFLKKRKISCQMKHGANSAAKEWADRYITKTDKVTEKARLKLFQACLEKNPEGITNAINFIRSEPLHLKLAKDIQVAERILDSIAEKKPQAIDQSTKKATESSSSPVSTNKDNHIGMESASNELQIAIEATVEKFTTIALKWLATNSKYHVADIVGQTKTSPVQGVSNEELADKIVDRMKQDKRLEFAVDPKGRPVFMLSAQNSEKEVTKSSKELELATQAEVEKFTTYALNTIGNNKYFYVANIEGQVKTSPVKELSREDFVARIVDRMKIDKRLKFAVCPNGKDVFILPGSQPTTTQPSAALENAIQAAAEKFTASAVKALAKIKYYHVAEIPGQVKVSPVKGISKDDFIAHIVDRMKQDKRLKYATDPSGNPVFMLNPQSSKVASPDNVKIAVQAAADKVAASAVKALATNPYFREAEIKGQVKTSPVNGVSTEDFIARVFERTKQDTRLKHAIHPDGGLVFTLRAQSSDNTPTKSPAEIAIQAAVSKFTTYALNTLASIEFFHVANIQGQVKSSPVKGLSKDGCVNLIVDRMKQDKRLKYGKDPRGNPVFTLTAPSKEPASPKPSKDLNVAIKAEVQKYTTYALNTLAKHEYYYQAEIEGQVKASPIKGVSREDFVAHIVNWMKQDTRLKHDIGPNGKPVFVLRASKSAAITSSMELTEAIQAAAEKYTASVLRYLANAEKLYVVNIQGQFKASPVKGISRDDFIARVIDRTKQDKRLIYAVDPNGKPIFKLANSKSTIYQLQAKETTDEKKANSTEPNATTAILSKKDEESEEEEKLPAGTAGMASYFQQVQEEETLLKDALDAIQAEAMKSLELGNSILLEDIFNAIEIQLPAGTTQDMLAIKLNDSLNSTLRVDLDAHGQATIVKVAEKVRRSVPLHQMTTSVVASGVDGPAFPPAFDDASQMWGSQQNGPFSDEDADDSSDSSIDSGESDVSSDDELGVEMHLAEDIPEDFLGIQNSHQLTHQADEITGVSHPAEENIHEANLASEGDVVPRNQVPQADQVHVHLSKNDITEDCPGIHNGHQITHLVLEIPRDSSSAEENNETSLGDEGDTLSRSHVDQAVQVHVLAQSVEKTVPQDTIDTPSVPAVWTEPINKSPEQNCVVS
ncbi:hypothetical protein AC1031_014322 [Aphanomyces cochlioides]|nr:hypothetical protein AC1031_014322 [Aphanomyces cochlioides]